ncbi:MAG: pitrilysin family protein [Gammaproteobacteria bacterium]
MKYFAAFLPALLSLSAYAAEAPDVDIPYERFVLDNGLRVIVHEDRKAPIVAVGIWFHVGSKDEKLGKTGFAHLFEHLMFNGSENYDDEYFKPFHEVGATGINGTTWFDRTNYFETVPTTALNMALWMESDRMGHLLGVVTQEKLDNQRGVVQNEKRQGDNQPYGLVEYQELAGLFPEGHPYRWSTIGSMEDLDAATLDDVHEWFKTQYGAANTVLVLAGDISPDEGRALAEKYFGDIAAGQPLPRLITWVPERSTNTREKMQDRVPQARIYRSWTVPGRATEERVRLDVAATILGSGKNSRLYKELVYDRQLATTVSAEVEPHELASIFRITITLRPGASIDEVHEIVDNILNEFLTAGPKAEEIERAQSRIAASFVRGVEQVGGFSGKASVLAQGELYADNPNFWKDRLDWFMAVSPESVQSVARDWLSKGYHQIDVVPFPTYTTTGMDVDRSALPVVDSTPDLIFPELQRFELKNGIPVVLAERHTIPVVNVAIQFDAGYAADAGRKLGAAGFTMAMLDEGTKRRDALEISAELETLGARVAAGSTLDTSSVTLSALTTNLEPSMDLFADVVRNPAFDQGEIDRLRPRWLAQIQQEKNQPVGIALRTLPPLLYGDDHAYGIPFTGSGTETSISSLTRDDMVAFHTDWLRPDNAVLFVVGATTMDEILPLLNEQFGNWKTPRSALPTKNIEDVELPDATRVFLIDKPDAPQSLILAGHLAPPSGVDNNLAIEIMNAGLGGEFTARVNMNLREDKGWAYGAYTFFNGARAQRPWFVYAPVQTDRTVDSIRELLAEFDGYLGHTPATAEELEQNVKNSVRSLPGQYETAGAVLGVLQSNHRYGRPDDYVTTLKAGHEALTLDDLHSAAQEVLSPDKLTWVIVGDLAKIEQPVRDMELGEVAVIEAR